MKTIKIVIVFAVFTLISGCASTGPLVSNVSYDASGKLVVEKCRVHINFFFTNTDLRDCSTHTM